MQRAAVAGRHAAAVVGQHVVGRYVVGQHVVGQYVVRQHVVRRRAVVMCWRTAVVVTVVDRHVAAVDGLQAAAHRFLLLVAASQYTQRWKGFI